MLEYGVRQAGRRGKVTARFSELADLAREACYLARESGDSPVTAEYVRKAIEGKTERHNLIETKIREHAEVLGEDMEAFIPQAVAEKLADADSQPSRPSLNDQEWQEKLRAFIDLHPVVTHFVDDSRESIYAGRGE
jgi:hypothetical protein